MMSLIHAIQVHIILFQYGAMLQNSCANIGSGNVFCFLLIFFFKVEILNLFLI